MHGGRQQHAARGLVHPHRHEHRLGQRRGAVVEARVGHVQAGERCHHGLVFVQQLQRALARLRLVRRVRRVELAARRELPDCGGNVMLVGAGADEVEVAAIAFRPLLHQAHHLHFGQSRRHLFQCSGLEFRGDLVEQILHGRRADRLEHGADLGFGVGNERHDDGGLWTEATGAARAFVSPFVTRP